MSELSSANLIITLDRESEEYTKSRHFYIRGEVKAIGAFLPSGDTPYGLTPLRVTNLLSPKSNTIKSFVSLRLDAKTYLSPFRLWYNYW